MSQPVFAKVGLDQEHLSLYPYCGKLFGYEFPAPTSRVVNSKESDIQYPWAVLVDRKYKLRNQITDERYNAGELCGGTVITDRYV